MDPFALSMPAEALPVAAIVDDRSVDMDALLTRVVRSLQASGRRVRGCVMERPPREGGCAAKMVLVDVDTGDEYLVSQPMGAASRACRADPQGFARASAIFRTALAQDPDLVVSNRFGELEVLRGGFTQELLAVMEHGIPLLTSVALRNVGAWQEFTGGATTLPPHEATIVTWVEQALSHARQAA
jgi:nucleoside-triphosphatase THEP1